MGFIGVEQAHDVRVRQLSQDAGLATEVLHDAIVCPCCALAQDLDGDRLSGRQLSGLVDVAEAAGAEQVPEPRWAIVPGAAALTRTAEAPGFGPCPSVARGGILVAQGDFFVIPERLDTERLRLRRFTEADSGAVFDYWNSDPNWARFNASIPAEYTETDAEKFVAELISRDPERQPSWAVTLAGKVVGIVSLTFEQSHQIGVIGYGVHGAVRGQGLSGEASSAVIDAAFRTYSGLRKLRAHTDARNVASMRVLEKLGFLREGVLRSNQYAKGEFIDEAIFGLLRREWSD